MFLTVSYFLNVEILISLKIIYRTLHSNYSISKKNLTLSEEAFHITAPFNNMRTLKFKAQLTNAFFATVNQMSGGSSQLPTTAEHCFVVRTLLNDLIIERSAVFLLKEYSCLDSTPRPPLPPSTKKNQSKRQNQKNVNTCKQTKRVFLLLAICLAVFNIFPFCKSSLLTPFQNTFAVFKLCG